MCKAQNWDKAEKVAKTMISVNIKPVQFVHVAQATTVKQMWENLTSVHKIQGQQMILALQCTLYCTSVQEGEDIALHLTLMRSLQTELHQMGSVVEDQEFKNIVMTSLPDLWSAWILTYIQQQSEVNSHTILTSIQDEWNRRKAAPNTVTKTEGTSMMAQSTRCPRVQTPNQNQKRVRGKEDEGSKNGCTICQQTNHQTKDCFFSGKLKCHNCGKFGHKATDCWSAGAQSNKTKAVPTQQGKRRKVEHAKVACNVQEDEEMEDAMYVTRTNQLHISNITVDSWLADSATSSHISNKRNVFMQFTPLHTHMKGVGGVLVSVEGKGVMQLIS